MKLLISKGKWNDLKAESIGCLVCFRDMVKSFDFEVRDDLTNEYEIVDDLTEKEIDLIMELKKKGAIVYDGGWRVWRMEN